MFYLQIEPFSFPRRRCGKAYGKGILLLFEIEPLPVAESEK